MSLLPAALDAIALPATSGPWFLLPGALSLWCVVMLTALRQRPLLRWGSELPIALLAGVVVLATASLALPGSLAPDRLAPIASGFGLVATAWAWPLLALRRARRGGRVTLAAHATSRPADEHRKPCAPGAR